MPLDALPYVYARPMMLEQFSFGAASSRTAPSSDFHLHSRALSPASICPGSPTSAFTPSHSLVTVNDLARQLGRQRISQRTFDSSERTPDASALEVNDDDALPNIESPYANLTATALRSRRQAVTRMQCDPAHLNDISALVERMVHRGEQCAVSSPSLGPSSSSSIFSDLDDDEVKPLDASRRTSVASSFVPRRTGKHVGTGEVPAAAAGVSKINRMRKYRKRVAQWSRAA